MKKIFLTAAVCAAMSVLFSGCRKDSEAPAKNSVPDAVKVARPIVADVGIWTSRTARIEAAESVDVRPRVGGYLDSICFAKGASVKCGDTIFKIDDRPFAVAVSAARARVAAAEAKVALAEENFRRAEGLFAQNAVSEEAFQTRRAEMLLSKAQLMEAKSALGDAELNLEYTRVKAPVSGKISENFVDAGNLVSPNASVLARIVRSDTVKVYFELDAREAVKYREKGLLAAIDSGRGPQIEIVQKGESAVRKGCVNYRDNRLSKGTATLALSADVENSDGGLLAGAFADVKVFEGLEKDAMLVPEEAVSTDLNGRFVRVVDSNDTVKYVPVNVGELFGKMRRIKSGLSESDRVVVVGLQRAVSGRKVTPETASISADSVPSVKTHSAADVSVTDK